MPKAFETEIDIVCTDAAATDQAQATNQAFSSGGIAVQFSTAAVIPTGCTLTNEALTVTIAGETFDITAFPQTITLTTGETFEVTGSYAAPLVTSTSAISSNYSVSTVYSIETDNCGNAEATSSGIISPQLITTSVDVVDSDNGNAIVCPLFPAPGIEYTFMGTAYSDVPSLLAAYQATLPAGYTASMNPDGCRIDVSYISGGTPPIDAPVTISGLPIRAFGGTDDSDINAVVVQTGTSDDGDGNDISNTADSFADEFKSGPIGANTSNLWTIDGVPGGALNFTFASGFPAAAEAGIIAAFSGSFGDGGGSGGYTFDKEVVRDLLVANGVWADGQEMTICGTVTNNGATSPVVEQEIQDCWVRLGFAYGTPGVSGPFTPAEDANIGGFGDNTDGAWSAGGTIPTGTTVEFWYSGNNAGEYDSVPTLQNINPLTSNQAIIIQNYDVPNFEAVLSTDSTGLQSFGNLYFELLDSVNAGDPGNPNSIRMQKFATDPMQLTKADGRVFVRTLFNTFITSTAANSVNFPSRYDGETFPESNWTIEVRQYALGHGNGIVVTGTENPDNGASVDPLTVSLDPSGTVLGGVSTGGAGTGPIFFPPASGVYYIDQRGPTVDDGEEIISITSIELKRI